MARDGAVGIITIDRPQRFNSMDVATARDFRKAGLQYARDSDVRCVVIRGVDRVFCSGADLKYIREKGDPEDFSYLQPEGVTWGSARASNRSWSTCTAPFRRSNARPSPSWLR